MSNVYISIPADEEEEDYEDDEDIDDEDVGLDAVYRENLDVSPLLLTTL